MDFETPDRTKIHYNGRHSRTRDCFNIILVVTDLASSLNPWGAWDTLVIQNVPLKSFRFGCLTLYPRDIKKKKKHCVRARLLARQGARCKVYESIEKPCAPAIDPLFSLRRLFSKIGKDIPFFSLNFAHLCVLRLYNTSFNNRKKTKNFKSKKLY